MSSYGTEDRKKTTMEVKETTAKSILVASNLPDTDYVVNPYTGCVFGCAYCYASFMGRFVGEPIGNWGNYLYVKVNAPEVLDKELAALPEQKRTSRVLLSSVTDAYQYAERKYLVTRRVLETFVRHDYPGLISILTKSPLVTRDIDLLTQLRTKEVGMTITTTDDRTSRELEVRAPLASARLDTLRQLHAAGLPTYAFIGPLLPHFFDRPDLLEELFAAVAETGVTSVFVEHINLKPYIRNRLVSILSTDRPDAAEIYSPEREKAARTELDTQIESLVARHGLSLRLGRVLTHGE
ncbi:MAG TPA: radical SAM protein [Gemmatimonadaceae bacterium]|nr:radical SAM protein [Gemmatimonadaceae bacterium]